MRRILEVSIGRRKVWIGFWALALVGALAAAEWQFGSPGDLIRTQVLGQSVKATPAPTITAGPSGVVASTSATFAYTDSEKGAAFQCALDTASLTSCDASGTTYSGLSDGGHTFKVVAVGVSTSAATSRSWTVDTTPPPAPTLSKTPDDPTADTKAQFNYRDSEAGVTFLCSLDGAAATACDSSGTEYRNLAIGTHSFLVRAVDGAGNRSTAGASFTWTILDNKSFGISGSATGVFAPGITQPLNLVLANPYNFSITVTSATVSVDPATTKTGGQPNPDCVGTTNLTVVQQLVTAVTVPANATKSLSQLNVDPTTWPVLLMPNLPVNQDACKTTTFKLSYSGTATKS